MIKDNLQKQITEAMKARDEVRLSTLRMLSSALHNAEIEKRGELSEEEELTVVRKESKKRKDAIEALQQAQGKLTPEQAASAQEKLRKEEEELRILQEFLPQELSDEELSILVDKAIAMNNAGSIEDIGRVMSSAVELVQGRADGKRVSEMVKQKLI